MHLRTHPKPESIGQAGRWQSPYHDTMIDHDKVVGAVLDKLDELGIADNTIVIYSTDNGPHMNTWPDGGMTPFRSEKNTNWEGAFRVPEMIRWPGKIAPGVVSNEIVQHHDWLPTFLAAAGEPDIVEKLKAGHTIGDTTFKVHIDGYDLVPYLTGEVDKSPRKGLIYFSDDGDVLALRFDNWKVVFMEQRVQGTLQIWAEPFVTLRVPKLFNLRTDPFERADVTSNTYYDWLLESDYLILAATFLTAQFLQTFVEFPPRQEAASFTIDQVVAKLESRHHLGPMSLASWNDGAARTAILEFVDRVTEEGGADYVPPAERVAVLDNDGTLWCEKPTYFQALFVLARLGEAVAAKPELGEQPVVKALLAGDLAGAQQYGLEAIAGVLLQLDAGRTTEEFTRDAAAWFAAAKHPRFGVPFRELTYAPMLELLELLREREFRVFIVTGGGVEFVRAIGEELYGVTPDDVVGSAVQVSFERRDGRIVLVRQAAMLGSPNEGPPKAVNIQAHIGVRPIFAAGNSAGDTEMLEYAHTGDHPSLCLVVDHDDEEREYAYAGASVTNPDAESIVDTASRLSWTVVSMRDDWSRIFAG